MSTKTHLCLYCKKRRVQDYGILCTPFCAECAEACASMWDFCAEPDCTLWAQHRSMAEYEGRSKCGLHGGQTFRGGKHS